MYAGQMRTRLLWQAKIQGQDAAGQPIDGWTDVGPDWADFRVLSGLEAIKADALTSVTKASCRVRYREDLTPDMRAMVAYRQVFDGIVVNDQIRAAVLLTVGHLYANREDAVVGASVSALPNGADYLLQPFKVYA